MKNLLIVDDEELILENLALLVEDYVDNVFKALNGEEGLNILEKEEILCVISDINMPVKDGIEFIKEVRERGNEIPFIFFTAHGNQELMMEAAKYGAFDFLDKPNFDGLEETVERGLQQGFEIKNSSQEPSKDELVSEYEAMLQKKKD